MNTEIKATANHSLKTFTLRKYIDNKLRSKYRTESFSSNEFNELIYNTSCDWFKLFKKWQLLSNKIKINERII